MHLSDLYTIGSACDSLPSNVATPMFRYPNVRARWRRMSQGRRTSERPNYHARYEQAHRECWACGLRDTSARKRRETPCISIASLRWFATYYRRPRMSANRRAISTYQ